MKRLVSIITYAAIVLCWVFFFALLTGCATTLKWPVPMPDGSVEWAIYKTPKFGRDSDFHFVLTTADGISLEIDKIDRSNADAIAEKIIEGALRAAMQAAAGGGG